MKNLSLNSDEIDAMREMYQEELKSLIRKIEKVKATLEKLGIPSNIDTSVYKKAIPPKEIYAKEIVVKPVGRPRKENDKKKKTTKTEQSILIRWEDIERRAEEDPMVKEFLDIMNDSDIPTVEFDFKKRQKKVEVEEPVSEIKIENYRRKKNILWSDYVYDVLRLTAYPLTVDEILNRAISELKLEKDEIEAAFAAIHSSLFRLKRNQKSVNNYALKGSRTSFYGLTHWFTKDGKLLKRFSRPEA